MRLLLLAIFCITGMANAQEKRIRCNGQQTVCQIKDKRVTIGDKIGVFSEDGLLVAIGKVSSIQGEVRRIKMLKVFAKVLRSHRAQRITDAEAAQPRKYFRIMNALADDILSAQLGMYTLGIGDGFIGNALEGRYLMKILPQTYLAGRAMYLSGSGKASAKNIGIYDASVDISAFGVSGGVAHILNPYSFLSFQVGGDLGFAMTSVNLDVEGDVSTILNSRIEEGTLMLLRAYGSGVLNFGQVQAFVSADGLFLHNTIHYGLSLGASLEI